MTQNHPEDVQSDGEIKRVFSALGLGTPRERERFLRLAEVGRAAEFGQVKEAPTELFEFADSTGVAEVEEANAELERDPR